MSKSRRDYAGETGRGSASSLSASELTTIVRRLGYIACKLHETIMSKLIADGDDVLAEQFNDAFKPVADWLIQFKVHGGNDDASL